MTKFHDYADEHGGYDFTCHEDFIKFLEKRNKSHVASNSSHNSQTNKSDEENKNKKRSSSSWKNLFFSCLKSCKKHKLSSCSARLEHVSGPVEGNCSNNVTTRKARKSVSGPLTCFFDSTNRADECSEVPYTSLCCRVCNDQRLQLYGPIYSVP